MATTSRNGTRASPASRKVILRHLLHWPWSRFSFISCHFDALDLPAVRFFRASGAAGDRLDDPGPAAGRLTAADADQIVFEGFDPESA